MRNPNRTTAPASGLTDTLAATARRLYEGSHAIEVVELLAVYLSHTERITLDQARDKAAERCGWGHFDD
jgi:hypothetical protein